MGAKYATLHGENKAYIAEKSKSISNQDYLQIRIFSICDLNFSMKISLPANLTLLQLKF